MDVLFTSENDRNRAISDDLRRRAAVSKTAGRGFESLRPCQSFTNEIYHWVPSELAVCGSLTATATQRPFGRPSRRVIDNRKPVPVWRGRAFCELMGRKVVGGQC